MPRINLLPWRDEERKERKLKFLVALGGAAIGALVVTGVGYMLMDSMVSAQEARNSKLDEEIAVLDRRSGGNIGNRHGTQMIRMEAVIRHDNHGHLIDGLRDQFRGTKAIDQRNQTHAPAPRTNVRGTDDCFLRIITALDQHVGTNDAD